MEKVVRLRCVTCKHTNYMTRKNKKTVQKKLEFKKFCPFCRAQTIHKESKK